MEYKRLYIAYGSNINLEQMANRCPNSKVVGKEMLKGMSWSSEVLLLLCRKRMQKFLF